MAQGKKLTVALFSQQSKSSLWIEEALKNYFDKVLHYDIRKIELSLTSKGTEILCGGEPIEDFDCLHVKGSFRYVDLLRAISAKYEGKCYNPIKPNAYTIGHDKLLTQIKLQPNKIPFPTTYLSPSTQAGKMILEKINYPIVMKLPRGTQGKGVMFADSYASASSLLDTLESLRQPFLIQEFVETDGVDIRALVVGDKVVAAMKRTAVDGEMRANIHAGGKGEPVVLDSYAKKIAIDAAKCLGAEICGVDLLEWHKGAVVLETNLSPGLQGVTACTKVDVADKIAKYLHKKTIGFLSETSENGTKELMEEIKVNGKETIAHEIITNLDFRGEKILLPEVINKMAKFKEDKDVVIKVENGKVVITNL